MNINPEKFRYNSAFTPKANVSSIKFGYDEPALEVELNELQDIQNESRKSLARRLMPSGFLELVSKDFNGTPIIYNPNDRMNDKLNAIAIAPSKAIVNGIEIILSGNFSTDGYDNYILLDLGEAPKTGTRDDLIYLEVWYESVSSEDPINAYGYINGDTINYSLLDSRVQQETSRRVCLRYDIKVANNIDFKSFPNGFGYTDINNFSNIQATVDGKLGYDYNSRLIFRPASDDIFKNCEFYKDYNLYVAGRSDYTFKNGDILGKYIFAIPMFKVHRRNQQDYTLSNYNGARSKLYRYNDDTSAVHGDLIGKIRPDKLYYDAIYAQDMLDLRRTIALGTLAPNYYLQSGLNKLLHGELQTNKKVETRRVQFGRESIDMTTNTNLVFAATYDDMTLTPMAIPNIANSTVTYDGKKPEYKDSVSGYGCYIDGTAVIKYGVTGLKSSTGTINFFMEPYWNGYDDTVQQILSVLDLNDNPVFTLVKNKSQLVFKQYSDISINNATDVVTQAVADLTENLIFAKQIYHIRISWSNDAKLNRALIYINGNVVGSTAYMGSKLTPARLVIGSADKVDQGLILEELTAYNVSYEQNLSNGVYTYVGNSYWPTLPDDFIDNKSLIYPSFNGLYRNFSDNAIEQNDTLVILESEKKDDKATGKFTLSSPYMHPILKEPTAYIIQGNTDKDGHIITAKGTWSQVEDTWYFVAEDTSLEKIIVNYSIKLPNGNGGEDLPNEMLAAGIVTSDTIKAECSFARINTDALREVAYANPSRVSAEIDRAYDKATTNRLTTDCYARLLYYHKSGDGTNHYEIPYNIYGYDIIGIINCSNRRITKIERIAPAENIVGRYVITLSKNVAYGDVVEFVIALGGITFDYETQTKTLVANIHKAKMVSVTCDGVHNEFIVPCYEPNGNGGVLKSVFNFVSNTLDETGKVIKQENKYACYVDNQMFPLLQDRNADGNLKDTYSNQLAEMQVDASSFGTPFLKITLAWTPPEKTVLTIPVLTSYQPTVNDVISVWYAHVPYQGILSRNHKSLRRISDWKYFVTTLSSGNKTLNIDENNYYSLNNIINRLPGGNAYASIITGEKINIVNKSVKADSNTELQFMHDVIYASTNNNFDESFIELDTDFDVYRITSGFQDERLNTTMKPFKLYFNDCTEAIKKYTGMASLVIDEQGQLLLFVIGCLNNNSTDASKENMLVPTYGDLYRIPSLPIIVQQMN